MLSMMSVHCLERSQQHFRRSSLVEREHCISGYGMQMLNSLNLLHYLTIRILIIGTILMGTCCERTQLTFARVNTGIGIRYIISVTPVYQSESVHQLKGWQVCCQTTTMLFGLTLTCWVVIVSSLLAFLLLRHSYQERSDDWFRKLALSSSDCRGWLVRTRSCRRILPISHNTSRFCL